MERIARFKDVNRNYVDTGVRIIELAQKAHSVYGTVEKILFSSLRATAWQSRILNVSGIATSSGSCRAFRYDICYVFQHALCLSQNANEKRKLLDTLLWNCILDGKTLYPTYRKTFDLIAEGVKMQKKLPWPDVIRTFQPVVDYLKRAV